MPVQYNEDDTDQFEMIPTTACQLATQKAIKQVSLNQFIYQMVSNCPYQSNAHITPTTAHKHYFMSIATCKVCYLLLLRGRHRAVH